MENCILRWYPREYLEAINLLFLRHKELNAIKFLSSYREKRLITTLSGKDSLVSFHLAIRAGITTTVVINRYIGMRKIPDAIIEELIDIAKKLTDAKVMVTEFKWNAHSSLFKQVVQFYHPDAVLTGLRVQEDGDWIVAYYDNGRMVPVISPITTWRHSDIWAYIATHGLPFPSIYCNAEMPQASLQSLI